MWWREVEPVCNALGWSIIDQTEGNRGLSFARWQRTIGRDGPFLVLLTGHFVAVGAGQFVDSNRRTPISLRSAPYRRKRIMRVARLIPNLTEAT
jgi:hypothetical protein